MTRFQPIPAAMIALALSCAFNLGVTVAQTGAPAAAEATEKLDEPAETTEAASSYVVSLSRGQLTFNAPSTWKKTTPRSRILEAELKVPAAEEDQQDARLTMMRAGGTITANVARWKTQFPKSNGSSSEATTKEETIADTKVTLVDISGTFSDSMGGSPFAGGEKINRENYRMLAAIVQTKSLGNYYLKLIGPKKLVDANEEQFKGMLKSMKQK